MLQTIDDSFSMKRSPKYSPPREVKVLPLREILSMSSRGTLKAEQLNLLDRHNKTQSDSGLDIFYAGNLALAARRCISVIGTRNVSEIGSKRAHKFARELAEAGVVVVSGLAAGVDTQALGAAIAAGGDVIAVIGTPINNAYPAANSRLQEIIYRDHLLMSQFPDGERVFPSNFPARNRTMAAISDASVIIEASESSGTLHQAAECVKLGRWLGITRGVVDDPNLEWPKKFLSYERCIVLDNTQQLLTKIYSA